MSDDFDPLDSATDPDTKYRFFPYVRRGYPPNAYPDLDETVTSVATAGTLGVDFTVDATGDGSDDQDGHVDIDMYGPGHVVGIDERQVVRVEPEPGTSNFPPNYFATVEFDAADLPWLFSPVSADTQETGATDARGRGLPWLCLVVLEKTAETRVEPAGTKPLPSIEAPPAELPPLNEGWAWAHAQLVGSPKAKDDAPTEQSDRDFDAAFGSKSNLTRSRLISPRNLQPATTYVAAVVPVFAPGVEAGLGREVSSDDTTMDFAWDPTAAGAEGEPVTLPVYHHWEFTTGETGDFEYLARQLEPRDLNSSDAYDIGFRDVDATDPGPGELNLTHLHDDGEDGPGPTVRVGGAIRQAESDAGTYAAASALRDVLNAPEALQELTDAPYEHVVGPPTYGDRHAQVTTLPPSPATGDEWLHALNLHPGHRLAAAVGAQIVRDNQEQLMASAWDQVGEVRKANRVLAAAQLSRAAMETGLRALDGAPTGWTAQFTAPAHDRVLLSDGAGTAGAHLAGSTASRGLTSAPFRRLLSGSGRLAGRLEGDVDAGGLLEGVAAGELSITDIDRAPAGAGTLDPGVDLREACEQALDADVEPGWTTTAREEGPVERLRDVIDAIEDLCSAIFDDLDAIAEALEAGGPGEEQDERVSKRLNEIAEAWDLLVGFIDPPRKSELWIAMADVDYAERTRGLPEVVDSYPADWADRYDSVHDAANRGNPYQPVEGDRYGRDDLRRARSIVFAVVAALDDVRSYLRDRTGSDAAYEAGVYCGPDPTTADPHEPNLGAVADAVEPISSLESRIGARLGGIDLGGRDRPLDRIMAYPEFPDPTYRDLKAVSEEYLLPGVSEIPRETFGALETNPQFIESFMVGLNHEMADELLWRGYPCTRRGSYFRQFWDPGARIPKPDDPDDLKDITEIHTWDDKGEASPLGSNVMTGAGGGGNQDAGQSSSVTSNVVVVVRGELLRRYPQTTVYATKAKRVSREGDSGTARVPEWPTADETDDQVDTQFHRFPIFRGHLEPDVDFLGFDLETDEATGEAAGPSLGDESDDWVENGEDDEGWFFVMEEPPGEVKFGIDVNQGDVGERPNGVTYTDENGDSQPEQTRTPDDDPERGWSGLSWGHLVGAGGDPATVDNVSVWEGPPHEESWRTVGGTSWVADELEDGQTAPSDTELEEEEAAVWGKNSAHMAYITWQRPVRIAIHADDLLPGGGGSG